MPLDLGETARQFDRLAAQARQSASDMDDRLGELLRRAAALPPAAAVSTAGRPFLAAQPLGPLTGAWPPPPPPPEGWTVAAVDGSHIDIDRHLPAACYLLNLGGCLLTYGAQPGARLFSRPHLAAAPEELYIAGPAVPIAPAPAPAGNPGNPAGTPEAAPPGVSEAAPAGAPEEVEVSGAVLGLVRTVRELETLADEMERERPPDAPAPLPLLGLLDGSLALWGLAGQGYPAFLRQALIADGLLPALDRIQALAQSRPAAVAAYVSYPRSAEVVNALRGALCPHPAAACAQRCNHRRAGAPPCTLADGLLDRDLFGRLLAPGWRSPLYRTNSSVPRDYYGAGRQVCFFYLNAGTEIGRVEMPSWAAEDETLRPLTHALIWDQCQRGQGYPAALSEAHEQAVIKGPDRRAFRRMLAEALQRQGLPPTTSEKDRAKRHPWL